MRASQGPGWKQLLGQDHRGQDGNPDQVHHAANKEQRHQDPAAAQAIEAMAEAHGAARRVDHRASG